MKTILRIAYLLASYLFVGWLSTSCNHSTNEASPQGTCRIQQYTATSKSSFSNTVNQTAYTYDSGGNLTKAVSTIDIRPITGTFGTKSGITTVTYTYDAGGYLTSSNSEQRITDIGFKDTVKTEQFSIADRYSYTSGRLTGKFETRIGTYNSLAYPLLTSYEYDSNGNLTKITEAPEDNSYQHIWVYLNNQLTDYVEKLGASEIHSFTVSNGLITSYFSNGYKVTWGYDNQQRQIKIANYQGDTLIRVTNQTWSNARPATASLPPFKGFPTTLPSSAFGQKGVLATSQYDYWNSISKTMQQFSEDTYTVQTNGQGFITGAVIVSKHPLAANQDYTTTETYTYTGCQ